MLAEAHISSSLKSTGHGSRCHGDEVSSEDGCLHGEHRAEEKGEVTIEGANYY